jgi:hypothetical protein
MVARPSFCDRPCGFLICLRRGATSFIWPWTFTGFRQRIERQLQQEGNRDDGPAPVAEYLVGLFEQPEQRLGQKVSLP